MAKEKDTLAAKFEQLQAKKTSKQSDIRGQEIAVKTETEKIRMVEQKLNELDTKLKDLKS